MEKTTRLIQLESELEQLRATLVQTVMKEDSQLSHPYVLPISQQLDVLIVEWMKEQQQQKDCT